MRFAGLKNKLKNMSLKNFKDFFGKRLWLSIPSGAAIIFLVLLAAPYYVTSQPSFYRGYKGVKSHFDSWKTSTHAEVNCVRCHVKPARPSPNDMPGDLIHRSQIRGSPEIQLRLETTSEPGLYCLSCYFQENLALR